MLFRFLGCYPGFRDFVDSRPACLRIFAAPTCQLIECSYVVLLCMSGSHVECLDMNVPQGYPASYLNTQAPRRSHSTNRNRSYVYEYRSRITFSVSSSHDFRFPLFRNPQAILSTPQATNVHRIGSTRTHRLASHLVK